METEKTRSKADNKSSSSNCDQLRHGMFEMMKKCCADRGGFPDCSTGMEVMREAMTKQHCCTPSKDAAESERSKK